MSFATRNIHSLNLAFETAHACGVVVGFIIHQQFVEVAFLIFQYDIAVFADVVQRIHELFVAAAFDDVLNPFLHRKRFSHRTNFSVSSLLQDSGISLTFIRNFLIFTLRTFEAYAVRAPAHNHVLPS